MSYSCNRCGKVVKSPRGLNLHIKACKIEYGLASQTFPSRLEHNRQPEPYQLCIPHQEPNDTTTESPRSAYSWLAALPETAEGVWNGIPSGYDEALDNDNDHNHVQQHATTSIVHSSGRTSFTSVVKTATYSIVMRKRAGHGMITVEPQ